LAKGLVNLSLGERRWFTVPRQQIVYTVYGCTRNMQSVQQGISREDCTRQDFSGKSIDVISKGKQWR